MFPSAFEYHAPTSVQEAVGLLGQYGEEAKVVAGGMSLIPLMKLRLANPGHLIDLRKVGGLAEISTAGESVHIGGCVTHAALATSELLRKHCPLVAKTALAIGDQQVRNRGTIGGSLVHADPSADLPSAMVALDAQLTLAGAKERTVSARDFFVDALTSAIEPGELLVNVAVPVTGSQTAYLKLPNQASGFAMVGVAAALEMDGGICKRARIGVTGVGYTAFRAASVEAALAGKTLNKATVEDAAEAVTADLGEVMEDALNGSTAYRRNLARVYVARAVLAAMAG